MIMTWMTMDTAPKNGSRLILWVPRTNKGIVIGRWESRLITHDYACEGWWLDGFDLPFHKEPYLPTLWQPLPEAPNKEVRPLYSDDAPYIEQ
jgi:hypothetical protein